MCDLRTIGRKNIAYVRAQVQAELTEQQTFPFLSIDYSITRDNIINGLSGEIFDLWRGAYTEIINLIDEELSLFSHNII